MQDLCYNFSHLYYSSSSQSKKAEGYNPGKLTYKIPLILRLQNGSNRSSKIAGSRDDSRFIYPIKQNSVSVQVMIKRTSSAGTILKSLGKM